MGLIFKRPQSRQPPGPALLNPRWISRGLVYADTLALPWDAKSKRFDTVTGTSIVTRGQGLTRNFDGVSAWSIQTPLTAHAEKRTYVIRMAVLGGGGNLFGRIFDKLTAGVATEILYVDFTAAGRVGYRRDFSASHAQTTWPAPASGRDTVLVVTYDSSAAANAPALYYDGVSQGAGTLEVVGSGTLVNNSDPYVIGNRGSDLLRTFDGYLSDFLIFDAILTASEIAELSRNPADAYAPLPRQLWAPPEAAVVGAPNPIMYFPRKIFFEV